MQLCRDKEHETYFVKINHRAKNRHIGIAVQDMEAAEATYTKLFGKGPYKREVVEDKGL